mgnify:CR=1 FL=1
MKDWFMNIDEVQLITFSPTCTSKQVGEAIVHGTGISSVSKVDLTLEAAGKREVPSHALAVITVPVYGGHVAPLALERMKELHADGAPAVVVVVYGNRAYEKALVELDAFVTKLGFKVIAGATFVGEHSYSSEKYPVASGRPDADDLEYAKLFGEKIRAKIAAAEDMQNLLYTIPNVPYDEVPEGVGADDNKVEKMGGMETELPKDALPHWETVWGGCDPYPASAPAFLPVAPLFAQSRQVA